MSGVAEAQAATGGERDGVSRRRGLTGLDRLFAILMILAVAFVHWQIAQSNKFGLMDGELGDTDAYTWMVRATDLMETGDWFDATLDRVNPPQGLEQHWTRPLDALIVGGALPLSLVMDTDEALFVSGTLVSPLLHLIGLAVLLWGAGPLLGRGRVPLLGILYLAQVGIVGYSAAGRPDHHALILLLTNAAIVLALRVAMRPPDRRLSLGLGAVLALGLWSGAEFLVTVFGCMLGFGLLWLTDGRRSAVAPKMFWTGAGGAVVGLIALFLERGGTLFAPAFAPDSFSAFHVFLLAVTAAFWGAASLAEKRGLAVGTFRARAGLAAGLTTVAALALAVLFPQFLAFDLVPMDPFYRQTRYANIMEFQPLITAHGLAADGVLAAVSKAVLQIGILLPALAFLLWTLIKERADPRWSMWLLLATLTGVMLTVYIVQGGIEFRDAPFLELVALVPYAELSYRIVRKVGAKLSGVRRTLLRPLTVMGLLGWYVFPSVAVTLAQDEEPSVTGRNACPVKAVAPALRSLNDPDRLQMVMAFVDFGPEIMYRSPHAVLSIPNHHAQPGYKLTWNAMTAGSAREARRVITESGTDFLLVCDSSLTRNFYAQTGAKNTFRDALIAGRRPDWLASVPLPESAKGFHLYRVVGEGT